MKKIVGIFMGGYSSEWEISMLSGQTVYDALNPQEWECYKVLIKKDEWIVSDGKDQWPLRRDTLRFFKDDVEVRFDVIFNAIHGHPGEDGYIQALFFLNNIPHTSCSAFESALTFNKNKTNALLKAHGILVPKATFFTSTKNIVPAEVCAEMGLPLFVKPNRSGSSFGISKVNSVSELLPAIKEALKEDNQIIVESAVIGTEMGCGVARFRGKTEAIAITEIIPKREFFDYQAKYEGASEEITPARIAPELYEQICQQSIEIFDYLGLWGVTRIDYIVQDNKPYLIEVNSIPGLSPASIIPQQLQYKNWELSSFFGGLLNESIAKHQHKDV